MRRFVCFFMSIPPCNQMRYLMEPRVCSYDLRAIASAPVEPGLDPRVRADHPRCQAILQRFSRRGVTAGATCSTLLDELKPRLEERPWTRSRAGVSTAGAGRSSSYAGCWG